MQLFCYLKNVDKTRNKWKWVAKNIRIYRPIRMSFNAVQHIGRGVVILAKVAMEHERDASRLKYGTCGAVEFGEAISCVP